MITIHTITHVFIRSWIRKEYNNPLVLITENGWSDYGELVDLNRIDYIKVKYVYICQLGVPILNGFPCSRRVI